MNVFVIGYGSQKANAEPICLYAGTDRSAAFEVLGNPGKGIGRTELLVNPMYHQRKSFEVLPGEVYEAPGVNVEGGAPDAFRMAVIEMLMEAGVIQQLPDDFDLPADYERVDDTTPAEEALAVFSDEDVLLGLKGVFSSFRAAVERIKTLEEAAKAKTAAPLEIVEPEKPKVAEPDEAAGRETSAPSGGDGAGSPGNGLGQDGPATGPDATATETAPAGGGQGDLLLPGKPGKKK